MYMRYYVSKYADANQRAEVYVN